MPMNQPLAILALAILVVGPAEAQSSDPPEQSLIVTGEEGEVDLAVLPPEALIGARVYDHNDKAVGEVSSILLDAGGNPARIVVDIGGFLGMAEKPVALDLGQLSVERGTNVEYSVYLEMTEEELEALPTYDD